MKKQKIFEVGQIVRLTGSHPWAGTTGKIVEIKDLGSFGKRPRVRLHDTCGYEAFIMKDSDAEIL